MTEKKTEKTAEEKINDAKEELKKTRSVYEQLKEASDKLNQDAAEYQDLLTGLIADQIQEADDKLGIAWRRPTQYVEGKTITRFIRSDADLYLQFLSSCAIAIACNPNFPLDAKPEVTAARFAKMADALLKEFKERYPAKDAAAE